MWFYVSLLVFFLPCSYSNDVRCVRNGDRCIYYNQSSAINCNTFVCNLKIFINTLEGSIKLSGKIEKLEEVFLDPHVETLTIKILELHDSNADVSLQRLLEHQNLEVITISNINNIIIQQNFLNNLLNLKELNIHNTSINPIDVPQFCNKNLKILNISETNLKEINLNQCKEMSIVVLDLGSNLIQRIERDTFSHPSIEMINLERNIHLQIDGNAFENLPNLRKIRLSNCNLTVLPSNLFSGCRALKEVYLEFNNLLQIRHVFGNQQLKVLNVSHNLIRTIESIDQIHLDQESVIDLSYNKISKLIIPNLQYKIVVKQNARVDLSHNNIIRVIENPIKNQQMKINLLNNPIRCDCWNYNFISNLQSTKYASILLNSVHLTCGNSGQNLSKLNLSSISCDIKCPKNCRCLWYPHVSSFLVNCSHRNLTDSPKLIILNKLRDETVHLKANFSNNVLTAMPEENEDYRKVNIFDLSNNKIKTITWLPPNAMKLFFNDNNIKSIDPEILDVMRSLKWLKSLYLGGNPWLCECSTLNFKTFLMENKKTIQDYNRIICDGTDIHVSSFDIYCTPIKQKNFIGVIAILSFVLVFALSLTIYYKYQLEIIIGYCRRSEDEDKDYDVYLGYSDKDLQYVCNILLPKLEKELGYKVCLPHRNFDVCDYRPTQVIDSISNSRRTLIVVSENSIKDEYSKLAFNTAHSLMINEKKTKVIVIIAEPLDRLQITGDLKKYISTNTYISSADKLFWPKLSEALKPKKKS